MMKFTLFGLLPRGKLVTCQYMLSETRRSVFPLCTVLLMLVANLQSLPSQKLLRDGSGSAWPCHVTGAIYLNCFERPFHSSYEPCSTFALPTNHQATCWVMLVVVARGWSCQNVT